MLIDVLSSAVKDVDAERVVVDSVTTLYITKPTLARSEIPLSPVGREQIHKLEAILLVNSILRPEVLEELRNPEERITWVDSLAVAAAALAREKAKMTVPRIAEEIGRTEATIRNHL